MPPVDSGHPALSENELNIIADWIAGLGCSNPEFPFLIVSG